MKKAIRYVKLLLAAASLIPLAVHGCVHKPLLLKAVTLQGRVDDTAPDTDSWGNGVLSRDKQINVAFADGKGVPPFQIQDVGQETSVSEIGFYCAQPSYWSVAA